jgi:hypothetical protein
MTTGFAKTFPRQKALKKSQLGRQLMTGAKTHGILG